MHRHNGYPTVQANEDMAAFTGLERTPLPRQPAFELRARHERYNTSVAKNSSVAR
jgi:hypothetical protein